MAWKLKSVQNTTHRVSQGMSRRACWGPRSTNAVTGADCRNSRTTRRSPHGPRRRNRRRARQPGAAAKPPPRTLRGFTLHLPFLPELRGEGSALTIQQNPNSASEPLKNPPKRHTQPKLLSLLGPQKDSFFSFLRNHPLNTQRSLGGLDEALGRPIGGAFPEKNRARGARGPCPERLQRPPEETTRSKSLSSKGLRKSFRR